MHISYRYNLAYLFITQWYYNFKRGIKMNYSDIKINKETVCVCFTKEATHREFNSDSLLQLVSILDSDLVSKVLFNGLDLSNIEDREFICSISRTLKAIYGNSKDIFICTNLSVDEVLSIKDSFIEELTLYALFKVT